MSMSDAFAVKGRGVSVELGKPTSWLEEREEMSMWIVELFGTWVPDSRV